LTSHRFSAILHKFKAIKPVRGEVLMAKFSYLLHDDYEYFAKRFLGVDYEDLVNLELGYSDEEDANVVEYEIPSFV
jgi:hypothetical protein